MLFFSKITFKNRYNMSIRKLKKAIKNSNGFLTLGIHRHGYYVINEDNKVIFHKKGLDVINGFITVYIEYVDINRLIIE